MKFWLSYLLSILLLGALFVLSFFILSPLLLRDKSFISPLPDFLTLNKNKQVTLLDLWSPVIETFADTGTVPVVEARAALLYDLSNNKVLYEKNIRERMPMASLTKIMTAIVAIEDSSMPDSMYVSADALVGENTMGLEAGELHKKNDLLYGLILHSGNDAAEVLSRNYPEGRSAFIKAMHDKAAALGLKDTQFSNPSGLEGDGTQYTTAYDLLVQTRYAVESSALFREIVSTIQHDIPENKFHKAYTLTNETNLVATYPGVKGVKTGYTPEAGMCLVTYYEKDGIKLIGVVLNSPNRRQEMINMLNYALKSFGIEPPEV